MTKISTMPIYIKILIIKYTIDSLLPSFFIQNNISIFTKFTYYINNANAKKINNLYNIFPHITITGITINTVSSDNDVKYLPIIFAHIKYAKFRCLNAVEPNFTEIKALKSFSNLRSLSIDNCWLISSFSAITTLTSLRRLSISGLPSITPIIIPPNLRYLHISKFYTNSIHITQPPSLKILQLSKSQDLTQIHINLPLLEKLHTPHCPNLTNFNIVCPNLRNKKHAQNIE